MSADLPTYEQLDGFARKHGSSYYLFYPDRFLNNLKDLSGQLTAHSPNSILAYALKANYMPHLCSLIQQHGFWAEVVSGLEYNIARQYLPGSRLIFNGPCKSEKDIRKALDEGALLNLDSFYEIDVLETLINEYEEVAVELPGLPERSQGPYLLLR